MRKYTLAEVIKSYRIAYGYTQEQLANNAGVSRPYILQIESGRSHSPSIWTVMKIAKCFGITVDTLLCDSLCQLPPDKIHN